MNRCDSCSLSFHAAPGTHHCPACQKLLDAHLAQGFERIQRELPGASRAAAISVWTWKEAPDCLAALSFRKGINFWVAYVPPGRQWSCRPDWLAALDRENEPEVWTLPDGARVFIGGSGTPPRLL